MRKSLSLSLLVSLFFFLVSGIASHAEDRDSLKYKVAGVVLDNDSGEPVYMATVIVKELDLWTSTDMDGSFELKDIPAGKFTIEFSLLGYETYTKVFDIKKDITSLEIKLMITNLMLNEVVVVAKEGGEITSASNISKQTIEHIQPSSLKDVMQLLPGNVTENPTLTSTNTLSIRDISNNSANIAGTALIVDGGAVSNDANMQMMSAGNAMNSGQMNTQSTAGGGIDVRQISTDNIESVEVIRGIPSVEYGDLTSGVVVVKTKAGVSPWNIRLKTDPRLKQVSLGKGFSLGEKNGIMNVNADYANAYSDIRTPSSAYNRVNFQLGYYNNFNNKLTMNVSLRGNYSNATNKSDPDLFLNEISSERDMGLNLNIHGKWIINKPWLTNIKFVVLGSIADQRSRSKKYQGTAGYTPTSSSMTDSEGLGFFTEPQYYSDVTIYGLPIDASARLTANLFGQYGKITNKFFIGAEWNIEGNNGRGKVFDLHCPPSPGSASAFRERSYKDIPFLNRITGFAEDNFRFPIGRTELELQAGVRVNGIFARNVNTSNFFSVEPRTNLKYTIIDKKSGFRNLSLRGGWGIAYKMAPMAFLYPEDAYKDMVSFSYNDFDANNYGMNVITTKRVATNNVDLRPQKSENIEAGIEFDAGFMNGSIVYFNEKLTHGFGFTTEYIPMKYQRFGYEWVNGNPVYTAPPSGVEPIYVNGDVTYNFIKMPKINDTTFMSLSRPVNNITNHKWGIEYTFDFAQIEAIRTTLNLSGAYMFMRTEKDGMAMRLHAGGSYGRTYPYVGIYAGSASSSNGSIRERFNTNLRIITHIPKIAMVVTLTAQLIFMDRSKTLCEYNNESLPYFYNENNERISGAEAMEDREHTKLINPLYIMNRAGEMIPFTQEMERDPAYHDLILSTNTGTYYVKQGFPFYGMLNLRITKEIKDIATFSFYANNFLNLRGRVKNNVTGYPSDRNTPIYFGAEIKINIK